MANSTGARLLREATREFAQHGYENTTIDAIAKRVGVTGAALYRHASSKEDLFCRCVELCNTVFKSRVFDEVEKIDDPYEKVRLLFSNSVRLSIKQPEIPLLLNHPINHLSAKNRKRFTQKDKDAINFQRDIMAEFIQAHSLDKALDPLLALYVVHGTIAWVTRWYAPRQEADIERLIDETMNILLHGLQGEAAPKQLSLHQTRDGSHYDFTRRHLVSVPRRTSSRGR
ncbi:MAG: TetR/AcrR family transcriptional regulator [Actinobacteria bacterium]|nr:TetR/AcrR family transcriptional regulator [Actinomycetota bacterium]